MMIGKSSGFVQATPRKWKILVPTSNDVELYYTLPQGGCKDELYGDAIGVSNRHIRVLSAFPGSSSHRPD